MRADFSPLKTLCTIAGTGITNGATASAMFDVGGWDYVSVDVVLGTSDSTSDKPTVVKLTEADATTSSSGATIAAFYMSTDATAAVAPTVITSGANVYRFDAELRPHKRYLFGYATPTTTQMVVFTARLGKINHAQWPSKAADIGAQNWLQG
jgi:hypothetical protein